MKAFPSQYNNMTGQTEYGMDLRDWFAGLAMQSLLNKLDDYNEVDEECLAHDAYSFAHVMLRERERMEAGDE
jgi:hypothetical protein